MELILEINDRGFTSKDKGLIDGTGIMITPAINEDYWYFRICLDESGQAIVGFPKFGTIGIGFAQEKEDWNANLPFECSALEIYGQIVHNKGAETISELDCIEAIELIREASRRFKGLSDDEWQAEQARMAKPSATGRSTK